jgi:hypothetical protein
MAKLVAVVITLASLAARAETPDVRLGAVGAYQRTDRNAWVFGPSLEVRITDELAIRGDAQLELGDFDDPFGPNNIRGGTGPHVNHVVFGPAWRPRRYAEYLFAAGAQAGVMVLHSQFAEDHFQQKVGVGAFVQAGRMLGPVSLSLQLRLDVSPSIDMAGPEGASVPTTTGRFNLVFEVPLHVR